MKDGVHIDYKKLRTINPETARLAVLEYLKTNKGNIADCAKVFGITRPVIYDILRKKRNGNLQDLPKIPKHQPKKTTKEVEDKVIEVKNLIHLGPKRLSRYLKKYEGLTIPTEPFGISYGGIKRNLYIRFLLTKEGKKNGSL